ncbi:MAG: adenylate/guanylate cyclase domain-containing protein [Nitrospira sp.]|nr:MAG: adenylate/guanylate cyclase domain-containing protein [Nitrospira sp.]
MPRMWLGKTRTIHRLGLGLSLLVTAAVLAVGWVGPHWLTRLEAMSYDVRLLIRGERSVSQEIVLVGVDDRSLQEVGRWPWSRLIQAELIDAISRDQPKVIGLDVLYTEPESILDMAKPMDAQRPRPGLRQATPTGSEPDRRFAESLKRAGAVVLGFSFVVPESGTDVDAFRGNPPITGPVARAPFVLIKRARSDEVLQPYRAAGVTLPIPVLSEAASSFGHVYSIPDDDGITRYEYLAIQQGNREEYFPSLGLELARMYLGIPREQMALVLGESVRLGDRVIPMDDKARMLLNFLGRERRFPSVSATDVLHRRIPEGFFQGKVVVVGTAALGTFDQKATPFSANVPGIEKNATVVENIIHSSFVQRPYWAGPLAYLLAGLLGLTLGVILPRARAIPSALLVGALLVGYVLATHWALLAWGLWLDVVVPVLTIILSGMTLTMLRVMTVERQAEEIRKLFTPYVGPQIVEQLIQNPELGKVGVGQRRRLTIMFCDIVEFTVFCERHSPEEVVSRLNEYLSAMAEIVFRWKGTLGDFQGDQIHAFWGAPLDQSDQVELAVKCALHMRQRLGQLREQWLARGEVPFDNGIGINTGDVLVGNIGLEGRKMDYAAIGDHVNLTARVERLTREFGVPILVTESTAQEVRPLIEAVDTPDNRRHLGHVALRELTAVRVKGKQQPVLVYELQSLARSMPSQVMAAGSDRDTAAA